MNLYMLILFVRDHLMEAFDLTRLVTNELQHMVPTIRKTTPPHEWESQMQMRISKRAGNGLMNTSSKSHERDATR